jgi:hypothetical protein
MKALMVNSANTTVTVGFNMLANGGKESEESSQTLNRFIRCPDCGEEIAMVPVLGQMIEAIENHIATHKDHPNHDFKVHPKAPCIRDDLTVQVLQRAAEISGELNKNQTWVNLE